MIPAVPEGRAEKELLRDILALTALQTTWVGATRPQVAESLAAGLRRLLGTPVCYVLIDAAPPASPGGTSLCAEPGEPPERLVERIEALLEGFDKRGLAERELSGDDAALPRLPPKWLLCPIGPNGKEGVIATGSHDADFPTAQARLLLSLGADWAGVVLRNGTLHQELLTARREIAVMEKMSALGQLVAGVAHELRTPLTYAMNHVFLAKTYLAKATAAGGPAPVERVDQSLDVILEALDRVNLLVGNLSRFTKTPSGAVAVTDLSSVVRQAADIFRATHKGSARLVTHLESLRPVWVDRVQIQEVVLNLLENASDAMPHGGTITLATRDTEKGVELLIEDEGPGIPPEVLQRIYEPFFTTKAEGTGLGLAIVARIVEVHGASIHVTTGERGGTTFLVRIPFHEAPGAAAAGALPADGTPAPLTGAVEAGAPATACPGRAIPGTAPP